MPVMSTVLLSTFILIISRRLVLKGDLFSLGGCLGFFAVVLSPVSFHSSEGDNSLTREETSLQRKQRRKDGRAGDRRGGEEMTTQHSCVFFCLFISPLKVCQQTGREDEEVRKKSSLDTSIRGDGNEMGMKGGEAGINGQETKHA